MWKRQIDGLRLTFRLAGINNQNFLMRDEQTGTYWQQISGVAISGPLRGRSLELVPSDELTAALWKVEQPDGQVLQDQAADASRYAPKDWEEKMQKTSTVLSYAQPGLEPRTLVLGIRAGDAAKAYPQAVVLKEKLVLDRLAGIPLAIVVGPDNRSIRAFAARLPGSGQEVELYRASSAGDTVFLDSVSGSEWNFQGCAVRGPAAGSCLPRLQVVKDYWFDWRHYNPRTAIFRDPARR